ncbi:MAG: hypothetical protein ACXWQZ_05675, partial [Ktedonobacterales bacterium]
MGYAVLLVRAEGKARLPQRYVRGVWVLLLAVALAACSVGNGSTSRIPAATPGTTSSTSALTPTALPAVTYVAIGAS